MGEGAKVLRLGLPDCRVEAWRDFADAVEA